PSGFSPRSASKNLVNYYKINYVHLLKIIYLTHIFRKANTKVLIFTMLSRNNIRIKVLHALYTFLQTGEADTAIAERNYLRSVQESYKLYVFNMLYILRVANYNKKDYDIKQKKLVPTEKDKKLSLLLYNNPVIKSIRENKEFERLIRDFQITTKVDKDLVRTLYQEFAASEYFESYQNMERVPVREHQYALVKMYKTMCENETFLEQLEDLFATWDDDNSLVFAAIKKSVRGLPDNESFYTDQKANPEFVHDFGKELLYTAIRHDEELQQMIGSKLKGWQEDRIAIIDMFLMKLALCEFLYFPSIPTKVTIDEYINLAKTYSTNKSKRFVNGVLDRLMKELKTQGKIHKTGRGLKE
ncbi:MAG: transcription antitermination factor NusB, partial [Saprospiraceae bacterium]|nr:transcription antitermination factor NusB [Saprospiraceae bacterium]